MTRLLILLAVMGCQPENFVPYSDGTSRPGQIEALTIVWQQTYGRTDMPPRVRFVVGSDLDAARCGGAGWWDPWWETCAYGLAADRTIYLPWPPGITWSQAPLAHEARHVILDGDPFHLDPEFKPGGLVSQAQTALRATDL